MRPAPVLRQEAAITPASFAGVGIADRDHLLATNKAAIPVDIQQLVITSWRYSDRRGFEQRSDRQSKSRLPASFSSRCERRRRTAFWPWKSHRLQPGSLSRRFGDDFAGLKHFAGFSSLGSRRRGSRGRLEFSSRIRKACLSASDQLS